MTPRTAVVQKSSAQNMRSPQTQALNTSHKVVRRLGSPPLAVGAQTASDKTALRKQPSKENISQKRGCKQKSTSRDAKQPRTPFSS